ncbi:MAG: hypothetical protein ACLFQS_02675 [Bacteroidales bacterium]
MKIQTFLFLILLTSHCLVWGQELLNESLRDGSLPTGWSENDISFVDAAGGYARFDETTSDLTSPTFSADGYASVNIAFSVAKFGSGGDGPLTLEYSLDAGNTWEEAGNSSTPTSSTYKDDIIEINETSANMRIRFNRDGSPSQKRLRDIVITGLGTPSFGDCGMEGFDNFEETGNSYQSGSFTGGGDLVWHYVECRGDKEITGKSIMIGRNQTPQSRFYVENITGGIGIINFDYMQAFTTDVDLDVLVNGVVVANVTSNSEEGDIKNSGDIIINVPGAFDLEFKNRINGAGHVVVDNITWTCFECNTPTIQADQISAENITFSEADISWNKGNGTQSLVLVREGSSVDAFPDDEISYLADNVFGEGDELGDDNFVVYSGDGNSFVLEGLLGGTTYHMAIYSYNCEEGNEKYMTDNPDLVSFTTPPASVSNLGISCLDNSSAKIVWDNPSGNFDGVVIGARKGNNSPHVLPSEDNPSDFNANNNFGDGYEYGGSTPRSYVVYNGSGNSVTIDFTSDESPYIVKAYTYKGTEWASSTPTLTIQQLGVADVDDLIASAGNTEVELVWTNPDAACFDEMMVVAHTSAITGEPTGTYSANSTDYTDSFNPDFPSGGKVVYNGTQSSQTITGLTNNQEYFFKIFVRTGNDWSSGIEVSATPSTITLLDYTDIALLGINTNISSGKDEIIFAILRDFTTNSSIDFTDNGYEREFADFWGTTEGVIRLVRTGDDLSAGTVVTLQGNDGAANPELGDDFDVFVDGSNDNDNWNLQSINGNSRFNLGSTDQLWIMQGGSWSAAQGTHQGVYNGKVLYGWSSNGWEQSFGYGNTSGSTLYPGAECYNVDVSGLSHPDKVKYTGDVTSASPREWVLRINNSSNWTGYDDDTGYDSGGSFGSILTLNSSLNDDSKWIGDADTDWFNCANWGTLRVPDQNTDVVIDEDASEDIVIDGIASVRNLKISDDESRSVTLNDGSSDLHIFGNLDINSSATFDLDEGNLKLEGNFTNQGSFSQSSSSEIFFQGNSIQQINLNQPINFENVTVDNASGIQINDNDLVINGELNLLSGYIDTQSQKVDFKNTNNNALTTQNGTYISGELKRSVASTGEYDFPVGDGNQRQNAKINITSSTNLNDIVVSFHDELNQDDLDISDLNLTVLDSRLNTLLDAGFWTIEANEGSSNVNYDLTLEIIAENMGDDPVQHSIVKREDENADWELQGVHDNDTQSENEGILTVVRSNLSGFSDFAVAKNDLGPLPVELFHFLVEANHEDNTVDLRWATASETNNDFFSLERSINTVESETIGYANGAGFSSETIHYTFTDHTPIAGISYYRLKQTDFDGSYEYTSWQPIEMRPAIKSNLQIVNITQDKQSVYLHIQNPAEDELHIYVHDSMGRQVYHNQLKSAQTGYLQHIIDDLEAEGMLIVSVANQHDRVIGKIIR